MRITADEYKVVTKEIPAFTCALAGTEARACENILVFAAPRISIPLSRSVSNGSLYRTGYDPKSLKLTWLEEGNLLRVSWTTIPVGAGRYTYQGDVIVKMAGGFGVELYREFFLCNGSAGMAHHERTTCDIQHDVVTGEVLVTLERTNHFVDDRPVGDERALFPLYIRSFVKEGRKFYVCKTRVREIVRYALNANRMGCQGVDASLEVLNGNSRLSEVARYLQSCIYPSRTNTQRRTPVSADEIRSTVAELLRMNPRLRDHDTCSGRIAFPSWNQRYIKTDAYDGAFGLAK